MRLLPRHPAARFVLLAVALAAGLYGVLYFPYRSDNVVVRLLTSYLEGLARMAGGVISIFDRSAVARGTTIEGRFPLQIVLDCSAADAQALLLAAILAFPAGWRQKVVGALAGVLGLNLVNLARIVSLYFIGIRWPGAFHLLHEEVIQILLVLVAAGGFALWARWARAARTPEPPPAPGGAQSGYSAAAATPPR
jgi:exosortase/archaeosortase family protein